MLGGMILADKCISAHVPVAVGTWGIGGLIPNAQASESLAACTFESSVVETLGMALELGV